MDFSISFLFKCMNVTLMNQMVGNILWLRASFFCLLLANKLNLKKQTNHEDVGYVKLCLYELYCTCYENQSCRADLDLACALSLSDICRSWNHKHLTPRTKDLNPKPQHPDSRARSIKDRFIRHYIHTQQHIHAEPVSQSRYAMFDKKWRVGEMTSDSQL